MTRAEAKTELENRIDFKIDNPTNNSGLFFENQHPIITLKNIRSVQPDKDITDIDFGLYLIELKEAVIFQVLADVFDSDNINPDIFSFYPSLFDNAISMQMLVKVINLILSSKRSNLNEVIGKQALQRIYFDLKGNKGSDKFPVADGIEHKYRDEIVLIKQKTSEQKAFVSITTR